MKKTILKISIMGLIASFFTLSCAKKKDDVQPEFMPTVHVPSQLQVHNAGFTPEDVLVFKNYVYVSGLGDGTIQRFNLTNSTVAAKQIVSAHATNPARWGLAIDESKGRLLSLANVNYAFDGNVSGPGKVFAYSLINNNEVASWTLPEGTIGNSIVVAYGFYYISDIGPNTRIIRLNPTTGEMVIKNDVLLPSNGFGFGNIIHANNGLYGGVNGKMWYIALDASGNFGAVSEVTGVSNVFSDGMTWAGNNTFYYAENDALDPANVGKVWKVSLTSNTSATTTLETNVVSNGTLNNPSGLFHTTLNNKKYLFVNESQLLNQTVTLPFRVNVFEIK